MNDIRGSILQTLALFAAMGRPLSLEEIQRNIRFANLAGNSFHDELALLKREGLIVSDGSHFTLKNTMEFLGVAEAKEGLSKRKVGGAKRLRSIFRFIPFIDFVLVAGSLAFGVPHDHSDIDVVVGAREGKIFTVRFFASFYLWLLGLRRGNGGANGEGADRFCLNHFVAPRGYELKPPRDFYWKFLYRNLLPVYGEKNAVLHFLEANKWAPAEVRTWEYFFTDRKSLFRSAPETILGGKVGNYLESLARGIQRFKFERSRKRIKEDSRPRIYFGDDELEFHPDTRRILGYLEKSERLLSELTVSQ